MPVIQLSLVSSLVGSVLSLIADTLGHILANADSKNGTDMLDDWAEEEKEYPQEGDRVERDPLSSKEHENDAIRRDAEDEGDNTEQLWKWGYRAPGEAERVMRQEAAAGREIIVNKQDEQEEIDYTLLWELDRHKWGWSP